MSSSVFFKSDLCQAVFSCSKSTIETEMRSKLMIKTPEQPEQGKWCCYGVFIVSFEQISHVVLACLHY